MTPRQRMLTAMAGGIPDRVPASPDTNWMIPAKLTGKPFWKVFRDNDPPIADAYIDCVRHFGIDGFSHHGTYSLPRHGGVGGSRRVVEETDERIVMENTFTCPAGTLTSRTIHLHNDAAAPVEKPIKDFEKEYECLKYMLLGDVSRISFERYNEVQAKMGDNGVVGLCMLLPTLPTLWREPTEAAFYDYYDHHSLMSRFIEEWTEHLVQVAQAIIDGDIDPDFVFFPNSGMVTMQSEDIMKEFSLPALKKLSAMFKKAGILTSLHCCGKERALVQAAAEETDLDCIDPLEIPPMGDCDLAELKKRYGDKLALKGNLHTTQVMLRMTPDQVADEAKRCLDQAMDGGGYILSTGDQCGRDTPEANIHKLVEVCEEYGRY